MARITLLLLLLSVPLQAMEPRQEVQQVLHSLGVQRFFASVEILVDRELQGEQADGTVDAERDAVIRQQLSGDSLQAAVEEILLVQDTAELYRQVIQTLGQEDLMPVIQSCHGQALQDYGPQLQAYQQQLQRRPAKPGRAQLAIQLDQLARTSAMASRLHSEIERTIHEFTRAQTAATVDWEAVEAERNEVLQGAVQTWYLYCGRFFRDDLLQALVDSYQSPAIAQVLDQYQLAVDQALQQAAGQIEEQIDQSP